MLLAPRRTKAGLVPSRSKSGHEVSVDICGSERMAEGSAAAGLQEADPQREEDGSKGGGPGKEGFRTLCGHYSRGCSFLVSAG